MNMHYLQKKLLCSCLSISFLASYFAQDIVGVRACLPESGQAAFPPKKKQAKNKENTPAQQKKQNGPSKSIPACLAENNFFRRTRVLRGTASEPFGAKRKDDACLLTRQGLLKQRSDGIGASRVWVSCCRYRRCCPDSGRLFERRRVPASPMYPTWHRLSGGDPWWMDEQTVRTVEEAMGRAFQ